MQLHSAIDQPNLTNIHSLLEHPEVAVGFRLQKNKLDVVRELTAGRIHGTFDTLAPCDFNLLLQQLPEWGDDEGGFAWKEQCQGEIYRGLAHPGTQHGDEIAGVLDPLHDSHQLLWTSLHRVIISKRKLKTSPGSNRYGAVEVIMIAGVGKTGLDWALLRIVWVRSRGDNG